MIIWPQAAGNGAAAAIVAHEVAEGVPGSLLV